MPTYNWLDLFIAALATWRISYMLVNEDGPRDVFISLRQRLGAYDLDHNGIALTSLGRGIKCIYCVSAWVGAVCAVVCLFLPQLLIPFALSTAAIWLQRIIRRE